MRLGVSLGTLLEHDEVIKCAQTADAHNVESIWIPESWGREAFVMLGSIATLTKRSLLGTGIVGIYSRSPASIAMAAATLDAISNGRALLGLGASSRPIVENWHGTRFSEHTARMREYVEIVRAVCTGEKVDYEGRHSRVKDFKLGFKPLRSRIPIYMAAVNERMLDLAAKIADGVIFFLRPVDEVGKTVARLKAKNKSLDIACVIITAVSKDPGLARERAKKTIAFYAAVGKIYAGFLASHGFREEVEQITDEYRENGLGNLHRFVTDRMLDSIALAGEPAEVRKNLSRFLEAGISLPIVQFNPVGDVENSFKELLQTLSGD